LEFDSEKVGYIPYTIKISVGHTPAIPSMNLQNYSMTKLCNWNFQNRVCDFWI